MQLQLGLDVPRPDAHIATITYQVLYEADFLRAQPYPDDAANQAAREHLLRGAELLLDWLGQQTTLPDEPLAWPCSACFAAPGEPCDLPQRVDKWTGPLPHYHPRARHQRALGQHLPAEDGAVTAPSAASARGRASRAKGAAFERAVVTAIRPWLPDARRSRDNGSATTSDTGDILDAGPIWWSCKDDAKGDLGTPSVIDAWQREAGEKAAPRLLMPIIVQKRRGHADPLRSWCWLQAADLFHLATGDTWRGGKRRWVRMELRDVLDLLADANYARQPA